MQTKCINGTEHSHAINANAKYNGIMQEKYFHNNNNTFAHEYVEFFYWIYLLDTILSLSCVQLIEYIEISPQKYQFWVYRIWYGYIKTL